MRILLALVILLGALPARAADRDAALDKVYEAADGIDAARAEKEAGREQEALRLLAEAEGDLSAARALDPAIPRIGYELARIQVLRGDDKAAVEALLPALRLEMGLEQHLRMVDLLDTIRARQGQPGLGADWARQQRLRGIGVGTLVGGLAVAAAGMALAYASFADAADHGVTDGNLERNRGAWALTGVGGGVAAAGLGLTVGGSIRIHVLQGILPGPWRLSEGRRGAPVLVAGLRISGTLPGVR